MPYKVFRQLADHSFLEIAQTQYLEDAEAVLANWHSGMITDRGSNIQNKNITSANTPMLPI